MTELKMNKICVVRLKKHSGGKTQYVSAFAPGNALKKFSWSSDPEKALHLSGIPEGLPPGIKVERVPDIEAFEEPEEEPVMPEKKVWYQLRWLRNDDTKEVVSFNIITSDMKRDGRFHETPRDAIMDRVLDRQSAKAAMDREIEMLKKLLRETEQ